MVLDGVESQEVPVISGVPQGAALGRLMFLCHINDLPDGVNSQVRLFADDCLLYRKIKRPQDRHILQQELCSLEQWANDWGMRFNSKKCYVLSVRNRFQCYYSLGGSVLQRVSNNPYLGIQFSDDIKWSTHISKITKQASSTIGFFRRNLNCSTACRRNAYLYLVRSVIEYGAIVCVPYLQQVIDRLERMQRQVDKFITRDYRSRTPGCVTKMLTN